MPNTKNDSGYFAAKDMDLIDILIGSDGTLGVMSEIEITLLPLPQIIWGASLLFADEQSSLKFVDEMRATVDGVASVEFFDSGALDVLREQKAKNTAFSGLPVIEPWVSTVVYVELHSDTEEQALERLFAVGAAFEKAGGKEENTGFHESAFTQAADDETVFPLRQSDIEPGNGAPAQPGGAFGVKSGNACVAQVKGEVGGIFSD